MGSRRAVFFRPDFHSQNFLSCKNFTLFSSGISVYNQPHPMDSVPPQPLSSQAVTIAVGSLRKPKLAAVHDALQALGTELGPGWPVEIVGVDVESGVNHTP